MSIEDDILRNEFTGNEGTVIDAEVVFNKPKKSRMLIYIMLIGLVIVLAVAGLFFNELKSVFFGSDTSVINKNKTVIHAAIPPKDLLTVDSKNATGGLIKPSDVNAPILAPALTVEPKQNPLDSQATLPTPQPNLTNLRQSPMLDTPETTNPVKPEFNAPSKPLDPAPKVVMPITPVSSVTPERFEALEQQVKDLVAPLAALSKKLDMLVSENKTEAVKPRPVVKAVAVEKSSPIGKHEITKNMKDLHIVALLSDGVMFEGDIAVAVGQFSKQLNGRIVAINAEQNTITTDSKIFKVQ